MNQWARLVRRCEPERSLDFSAIGLDYSDRHLSQVRYCSVASDSLMKTSVEIFLAMPWLLKELQDLLGYFYYCGEILSFSHLVCSQIGVSGPK